MPQILATPADFDSYDYSRSVRSHQQNIAGDGDEVFNVGLNHLF